MRRGLLYTGSFILLGLLALVITAEYFSQRDRRFTGELATSLPRNVAGWTRRDIPVADSKAGNLNVQGILNFTQAAQALYVRGDTSILVYAAYWAPGKASVVDAGSHNPDSCWVNSGCVRTERRYAVAGQVAGRAWVPYEFGQYLVPSGGRQNVAFWHLVNGQPNRYEEQNAGWRDGLVGRLERLPLLWKDIRTYGLNQKSEQMFIRLSSNLPIEQILADPANRDFLQALQGLGIFADQPWK